METELDDVIVSCWVESTEQIDIHLTTVFGVERKLVEPTIAHAGQGAKGGFVLNDGMKYGNVPDRLADHLLTGPTQQTDETRIHLYDAPGLCLQQHHRIMDRSKPLFIELSIAEFALLHCANISEDNNGTVDLLVLRLVGANGHHIPELFLYLHIELNR